MKENSLLTEENKMRGKDITALKIKCAFSLVGCFSSVFVFFCTLMMFTIGKTEKLEIFPLVCLMVGTGGFSMSMIMIIIWFSRFVALIERSPGWQHLLSYGKSDLTILGIIGSVLVIVGLLLSWTIPSIGITLLVLSAILVVVLVGYLMHQINTELEQRKFHA